MDARRECNVGWARFDASNLAGFLFFLPRWVNCNWRADAARSSHDRANWDAVFPRPSHLQCKEFLKEK